MVSWRARVNRGLSLRYANFATDALLEPPARGGRDHRADRRWRAQNAA